MKRILIAGCGDLGSRLGRRLHQQGHEVFGLRRRVEKVPADLHPVQADLADPASLRALPEDIATVYVILTADAYAEAAYQRTYVAGTRTLLDALLLRPGRPVERVIFVSSTSVYGQQQGEWVDEDSPTEPVGFSGRAMLEAERLVQAGPWTGIAVRCGGIYGGSRRGLVERVAQGRAMRHPGAPRYINLNHIEDVVGSLLHLGAVEDPAPVYIGTDGRPPDRNELVTWMAAELDLPPPPESSAEEGGRRRDSNKRCRNDRLLATGYSFRYPDYRAGYTAVLKAG